MYKAEIINHDGTREFLDFTSQGAALQALRGMYRRGEVLSYELFKVRV